MKQGVFRRNIVFYKCGTMFWGFLRLTASLWRTLPAWFFPESDLFYGIEFQCFCKFMADVFFSTSCAVTTGLMMPFNFGLLCYASLTSPFACGRENIAFIAPLKYALCQRTVINLCHCFSIIKSILYAYVIQKKSTFTLLRSVKINPITIGFVSPRKSQFIPWRKFKLISEFFVFSGKFSPSYLFDFGFFIFFSFLFFFFLWLFYIPLVTASM